MRIVVIATYPWDADDGRIFAPGEVAEVQDSDRVREAIRDALIREDDSAAEQAAPQQTQQSARFKPRTADEQEGASK